MYLFYYFIFLFWIFLLFLNWDNFLFLLILMEGISISILMFLSEFVTVYCSSLDCTYLMLSVMVIEASFGLSMLIYLSFSSDSYNYSIGNMF